ncbi:MULTISPECIES: ion channel [unclassified Motilimonas]|uniref:pentapeptide repeat-containing protein n=1 Tax=unclassified Motilimonas TaxID=2643697 RepID=UPI001E424253|nr:MULTISPECIES: ion channel [unclassified Motilimonas]MCE0557659.1 pentapeptide repeat-containing protein [Motilimonas sp. E26]MDO6527176.1 ion channel [Motilimonas sp. 1_MG-2023]
MSERIKEPLSECQHHCQYVDHLGAQCEAAAGSSGLCFWHDPNTDKSGEDIASRLEQYAAQGGMLHGLALQHANLEGVNLVKRHSKTGYDLTACDFYRANLRGAHLFNASICKGSLMKADLTGANIHCVHLEECNLLGVKLIKAKIDNVKIGKKLLQEQRAEQALKENDLNSAWDNYEQAEEIYRDLRKASEQQGLFTLAGPFLQQELKMRRYQMPKWSFARLFSKTVDLFCGYGEDPLRVVLFSILLIIVSAIFYFIFGISFAGEIVSFNVNHSIMENFISLLECLYYSVVTFTTLGYGDFTPIGLSRGMAAIEAFTGSFTIALFVVVFVKKMTR